MISGFVPFGLLAAPNDPDKGFLDGTAPALGNTRTAITRSSAGHVYFAGRTGSDWRLTKLTANYPIPDQTVCNDFLVDAAFHRAVFSGSPSSDPRGISAIVVTFDGILVSGDFQQVDGVNQPYLAKLHLDGTLDATFQPHFNGPVHALGLQIDGRIVVGGSFTEVAYTTGGPGGPSSTTHWPASGLARLESDGDLDNAFTTGDHLGLTGGTPEVRAVAVRPGGSILIGGRFDVVRWHGVSRAVTHCTRLRPGGDFDSTFRTTALEGFSPGDPAGVDHIVSLPDGKALLGGHFVMPGDTTPNAQRHLARIDGDGSPDESFDVGSFTSPDNLIDCLCALPDGGMLVGFRFPPLSRGGLLRVLANGSTDHTFDTDIENPNRIDGIALLPDGSVLAAGKLAAPGWSDDRWLTRVFADGSTETGTGFVAASSLPITVRCTAVMPDGRIIVGGHGSGGFRAVTLLHANGTTDLAFNPIGVLTGDVKCLAVLPDGLVLVGGDITGTSGSSTYQGLALIDGDREIHQPGLFALAGEVRSMAQQADGKVLLAGNFTLTSATGTRSHLARLNADRTLDSTFSPNLHFTDPNPMVWDVDVDAEGRVLVAGNFDQAGGVARTGLARLTGTGVLDAGFNPVLDAYGPTPVCGGLCLLADGKLVLHGTFFRVNGDLRPRLARLNSDGTTDGTFTPYWPASMHPATPSQEDLAVLDVTAQTNGQLIAGRQMQQIQAGDTESPFWMDHWSEINRVDTNGTALPLTWVGPFPGTYTNYQGQYPILHPNLSTTTIQGNGQMVLGGAFPNVGPIAADYSMARLQNDPVWEQLFVINREHIVWTRYGAGPVLHGARFEISTDGGLTWSDLGAGVRADDGWDLTGLSLPPRGIIRATARVVSGGNVHGAGSSCGLVRSCASYGTPLYLLVGDWLSRFLQIGMIPPYILPGLDADQDGFSNLAEYAFGTRPDLAESGPSPLRFQGTFANGGSLLAAGIPVVRTETGLSGPDHRALYLRRKDREESGLVYQPQFSLDLETWAESDDPGTVLASDTEYELVAVRFPADWSAQQRQFFRLQLTAGM